MRELFEKSSLKLPQKLFGQMVNLGILFCPSILARALGLIYFLAENFALSQGANVNRLRKSIEVQQKAYIKLFAEQDFLKRLT